MGFRARATAASVGFGLVGSDSGFGVGVATGRARGGSRWLEELAGKDRRSLATGAPIRYYTSWWSSSQIWHQMQLGCAARLVWLRWLSFQELVVRWSGGARSGRGGGFCGRALRAFPFCCFSVSRKMRKVESPSNCCRAPVYCLFFFVLFIECVFLG